MTSVAAAPATARQTTVGDQLRRSPVLAAAVEQIVREVRAASARITDVRGPADGLRESYDALMARAAAVRGRALLYPYIGSGAGNGALVELADGSVKWDMISGIGVYFFGHADPELTAEALFASVEDTLKHGNLQSTFEAYAFAETLVAEASRASRLRHAFVSPTGALANESALKVCFQKHAPASRVLAFRDCFMGRTITMSQVGDSAANRQGIPLSTLVDYMPFYDEAAAARLGHDRYVEIALDHLNQYIERYPGQHACFIFELVQGEGGFNVGPADYFRRLMERCRAAGIAVWDDEIQTFGRTETMFAFERFGLGDLIDVVCVGKMTQACATLFTPEYNPKPGLLSGTFTGETPSFRVGRRVVERLRDGGYYGPDGSIARHHAIFRQQVAALVARRPAWFPEVRGVPGPSGGTGGMMRFTPFGGAKDAITKACRACFDEGVIVFYCGHGPYHVRMLPPLGVMRDQDWPRVFDRLERGLAKAAG